MAWSHVVEIGTASAIQLLRWALPWVGGVCFAPRDHVLGAGHPTDRNQADGGDPRVVASLYPDSVLPPYEQLRRQIAAMITLGSLDAGTRLRRSAACGA